MRQLNASQLIEFENLFLSRPDKISSSNKLIINTLLCEFARRLLLCKKAVIKNNPYLDLGPNIIFDYAFIITKNKVLLPKLNNTSLSFFDKLAIESYFNWQLEKSNINSKGYSLINPFPPFIKIFKVGGKHLKYQYSRLEIYPFTGINIINKEEFLDHGPFWLEENL